MGSLNYRPPGLVSFLAREDSTKKATKLLNDRPCSSAMACSSSKTDSGNDTDARLVERCKIFRLAMDRKNDCVRHGVTPCCTNGHVVASAYNPSHGGAPVPTAKPRIALTLDADVHAALKEIAKAERRSLSNLIEGWVIDELKRRKA